MKKQTIYTVALISGLVLTTGSAFAQVDVSGNAGIEAGGLGKGLSNMVRGILGEQEASSGARFSAPAEPSVMMQMDAAADMNAQAPLAPQAMTMSLKAANAKETIVPMSVDELAAYVHQLILSDSNIQSVDTSDSHVRVTYAVPSKVFRLMKVTLRVTVGAQASGQTEVTYPWYAFATARAASDLKTDMQERIVPLIPAHAFTPDEQRMLIDEIHLMLEARLGSSTGGDR